MEAAMKMIANACDAISRRNRPDLSAPLAPQKPEWTSRL
jgi:hypothetical protein